MLRAIHEKRINHPDQHVRAKYQRTFDLYRERYARTVAALESNAFDLRTISESFEWGKLEARFPEDFNWASRRRNKLGAE